MREEEKKKKKVADLTSNGEGSKKNNLGPCESGFPDARRTRQDATALPAIPPSPMQCQQRDIDAYLPGQLGTTRRKLAVQSRTFQSSRRLRAHETPQQINEGGWGVSVKGGNLGSEGLELATPDRQPANSYRDTHLARVLARARWSTLYLGQARRSLISWMTWRIRPGATNEERVTFDNLLLPPASQQSQPASQLCHQGQKRSGGMPR